MTEKETLEELANTTGYYRRKDLLRHLKKLRHMKKLAKKQGL